MNFMGEKQSFDDHAVPALRPTNTTVAEINDNLRAQYIHPKTGAKLAHIFVQTRAHRDALQKR
jgi:hypothetical protein